MHAQNQNNKPLKLPIKDEVKDVDVKEDVIMVVDPTLAEVMVQN